MTYFTGQNCPPKQLGLSVLCEYAIAAYCHIFAYFSKVRISHIFPYKLAFSKVILNNFKILCVSIWMSMHCHCHAANTNRICAFPRLGQLCNHSSPYMVTVTVCVQGVSCGYMHDILIHINLTSCQICANMQSRPISAAYWPSPPLDNIPVMVIVWRLTENIIRTALCWIVWHNVHSPQHTYVSSSHRSNRLGLSHWDPNTVCRGGCLELYYCNMVEWFWCDSSLISTTNWFPSVLWHCLFGHLAYKNRPRNDL